MVKKLNKKNFRVDQKIIDFRWLLNVLSGEKERCKRAVSGSQLFLQFDSICFIQGIKPGNFEIEVEPSTSLIPF